MLALTRSAFKCGEQAATGTSSGMSEHPQSTIYDPTQAIEIDPKDDHTEHQHAQQHVVGAGDRDDFQVGRPLEKHRPNDARVVVERNRAVQDADDRQGDLPASASIHQRLEEVELPYEARERWKSGQAE